MISTWDYAKLELIKNEQINNIDFFNKNNELFFYAYCPRFIANMWKILKIEFLR